MNLAITAAYRPAVRRQGLRSPPRTSKVELGPPTTPFRRYVDIEARLLPFLARVSDQPGVGMGTRAERCDRS